MLKQFALAALMVTALTAVASAQTAPKLMAQPAVAAPAAPWSPNFDAYFETRVGFNWGTVSDQPVLDSQGAVFGARGTLMTALTERYGFQFDGVFDRTDHSYSGGGFKTNTTTLAAHSFWRDPKTGLIGVIGQYTNADNTLGGVLGIDRYYLGAEAQYFANNLTFYGQVAYINAEVPLFVLSSNLSGSGYATAAQIRYFATPDLQFTLKGGLTDVTIGDTSLNNNVGLELKTWSAGAKAEYRLASMPASLFSEVSYQDTSGATGTGSLSSTKVTAGFKIDLGTRTLLERDRSGASLDPFEVPAWTAPFFLN